MKNIQNGYELWISCASRGVAVLTVRGTIVPVELSSFSASVDGNNVTLNWSTSTETNNSGFEIQRSINSKIEKLQNWESIGFVDGKGTTTETQTYSFADNDLSSGNYLYRLKQIDFDGTFEYSNEVEVNNMPAKFSLEQNYPNPFNPSTMISWQSSVGSWQTLKIYDVLGNEVATLVNEYKQAGVYKIEFDGSSLSSGVYFISLKWNNTISTRKMVLLK